jgi:hypothetical protein
MTNFRELEYQVLVYIRSSNFVPVLTALPSPNMTFKATWANPQASPKRFGKYMFTSFISKRPTTDQRKQFKTVARVKGRGILLADRVCKTVFNAASGEPNIATQNKTAAFPMIAAGSFNGER